MAMKFCKYCNFVEPPKKLFLKTIPSFVLNSSSLMDGIDDHGFTVTVPFSSVKNCMSISEHHSINRTEWNKGCMLASLFEE